MMPPMPIWVFIVLMMMAGATGVILAVNIIT